MFNHGRLFLKAFFPSDIHDTCDAHDAGIIFCTTNEWTVFISTCIQWYILRAQVEQLLTEELLQSGITVLSSLRFATDQDPSKVQNIFVSCQNTFHHESEVMRTFLCVRLTIHACLLSTPSKIKQDNCCVRWAIDSVMCYIALHCKPSKCYNVLVKTLKVIPLYLHARIVLLCFGRFLALCFLACLMITSSC